MTPRSCALENLVNSVERRFIADEKGYGVGVSKSSPSPVPAPQVPVKLHSLSKTDPQSTRQDARMCDLNLNNDCTRNALRYCNIIVISTIHHGRSRQPRGLGGCIQGHRIISWASVPHRNGPALHILCARCPCRQPAPRATTGKQRCLGRFGRHLRHAKP